MIKMKKIIYLLFTIILLFPIGVKASDKLNIICPEKANSNTDITCNISAHSDKLISSVSFKLNVSYNLELISFDKDSIWNGSMSNSKIDLYTDDNKTGDFKIGIINLKIKNTASSINQESLLGYDIKFYDDKFEKIDVDNNSSVINVNSIDNYLQTLSVSGYSLKPGFNKNTQEYSVDVDKDKIRIEAISSSSKASITGTGNKSLNKGLNKFVVSVKSEAGTTRNYILNVNYNPKNTTNNTNNKENMNPNTTGKRLSDNNYLKSLDVEGYNIEFKKDVYEYNIDVEDTKDKLDIKAEVEDNNAKIKIDGNEKLAYGKNVVVIQVTSESNKLREYKLIVNRKAIDSCLLDSIKIEGYKIDFDKTTFIYRLAIGNEDKLNIKVTPFNENAEVEILDNNNLVNGSVITIRVKNDDSKVEYQIYIKKNREVIVNNKKKNNNFLLIAIFIVLILILIIMGILIFGRKKKNKTNNIVIDLNKELENNLEEQTPINQIDDI